jgi:hypothetical protein
MRVRAGPCGSQSTRPPRAIPSRRSPALVFRGFADRITYHASAATIAKASVACCRRELYAADVSAISPAAHRAQRRIAQPSDERSKPNLDVYSFDDSPSGAVLLYAL